LGLIIAEGANLSLENLHWLSQMDHELELVLLEFLELQLRDVVEGDVQLVHPI
jgi:hypothetical protein